MQIYHVGGVVRDALMSAAGLPTRTLDCDWVVVGATPEEMLKLGYLPVGEDFPVFLHPKTHEEYALARTERKTAPGYHGFVFHAAPDVTLEEDLRRRDLTINAMAQSLDGEIIDPFGGRQDLQNRVLRHVSDAFCEDPVRILRTARFAARFPSFSLAPETLSLMRRMVGAGEVDALVPERVLAEFVKGLAAPVPTRMLDILEACGFWDRLYPSVPLTARVRRLVHLTARENFSMAARIAALAMGLPTPQAVRQFLTSLRANADWVSFAETAKRIEKPLLAMDSPQTAAEAFQGADALRRPDRMREMLRWRSLVLADRRSADAALKALRADQALQAWLDVDAGAVARAQSNPKRIAEAVRAARMTAVDRVWQQRLLRAA